MSAAELLERALCYTFGAVDAITPDLLAQATPCPAWDLRALLHHLNDSLAALREAVDTGQVEPPTGLEPTDDPMAAFRAGACGLLGAWTAAESDSRTVDVGEHRVAADLIAVTGALEVAVHGWDIFRACGHRTPIPPDLALDILQVCPLLVSAEDRQDRFADRVPVVSTVPSDWLVGFLGRNPRLVGGMSG